MRLGLGIPIKGVDGLPLDAEGLGTRARWIEDSGLDGIWFNDASFRRITGWPDPLMWLLTAANATREIEVGTAVYQVPLRTPVDLAQRFMTIEALTHGRFTVGVGPGSHELGHLSVGVPHAERFKMFYEQMDTIRRLCRGEQVGEADLQPWPSVQDGPKFILGAWASDVSLRHAVNEYNGWMCSSAFTNIVTMGEGLKRYRDLGGTRAMMASCRIDLWGERIDAPDDGRFTICCGPEEATDRLGHVAELGFDDILLNIFDPARPTFEGDITLDQAEEIRSLFPKDQNRAYPLKTA